MSDFAKATIDTVRAAFPDAIEAIVEFRDETTLVVQQSSIVGVLSLLRDAELLQFNLLEDIVADDMQDEFPRFAVNYQLYSIPNKERLRVRVPVEDPDVGPHTISALWLCAEWLEMEVYDLMGIRFENHKNLRRLFLPQDWQGYPLRKDYPLGYETVQFSFNYEKIDDKKPYAKD